MAQLSVTPTPSTGRLEEALKLLSEAVRLLAIDANGGEPNHPPLERARKLAEEAQALLRSQTGNAPTP